MLLPATQLLTPADVEALSAPEAIDAQPTAEFVVTRPTVGDVVTVVGADIVSPCPPEISSSPEPAAEHIGLVCPDHAVVAASPEQHVCTLLASDGVIARAAAHDIVAQTAEKPIA